jgi:hypothetical protein
MVQNVLPLFRAVPFWFRILEVAFDAEVSGL